MHPGSNIRIGYLPAARAFPHAWRFSTWKQKRHLRSRRFNWVATLGLTTSIWIIWAVLLALPGVALGPGVGTLFLIGIYAAVGLGVQLIATFRRPDLKTFPLTVVVTTLGSLGIVVLFEGDMPFTAFLSFFLLFVAPVAGAIALVRWMCFANRPEQPIP